MSRIVVNVATRQYARGQQRLRERLEIYGERGQLWDSERSGPDHASKPYAFKAHALLHAMATGYHTLLWCDASVYPIRALEPLWEKIERDGYWIARNGWTNYEWTADSAYPDLFPGLSLEAAREINKTIPHVVATAFGVSVTHPVGLAILTEYYRLANSAAFCGPWINATAVNAQIENPPRLMRCGPADVRGHRHDQTALSVIASRQSCVLSDCPEYFAYHASETAATILLAKGI